jgi:hypothetical protein
MKSQESNKKRHGVGVCEVFGTLDVIRRFNQAASNLVSKLLKRENRDIERIIWARQKKKMRRNEESKRED